MKAVNHLNVPNLGVIKDLPVQMNLLDMSELIRVKNVLNVHFVLKPFLVVII